MAIKILIGGSPCTYWSVAKKEGRETEAKGMGWELFKNYLIAKEKFKPDFFLYENNKSASQAIKDQISEEFGVGIDPDVRFTYINSALVSAQNRQRFYVTNFGDIAQPEDRGILLRDILVTGATNRKGAKVGDTSDPKYLLKNLKTEDEKTVTLTAASHKGIGNDGTTTVVEPVVMTPPCGQRDQDKARTLTAGYANKSQRDLRKDIETDGFMGAQGVIEYVHREANERGINPVLWQYPHGYNPGGAKYEKAPTLTADGSWVHNNMSVESALYPFATPVEWDEDGVPTKARSCADGKIYTVYKVENGQITIKGKQYPIKLADGYYIIRKLTVTECARLQTMPDDYCKAVSDSQAYKALGNGWTAEVIIHLLNHALKDIPRDEEIVVLSMYDGIATGRYCLDKMGFTNVTYHAYEIDKYPIQVAMDNYPDIIQHGDAFAVREDDWKPPQTRSEWLDELLGGDL